MELTSACHPIQLIHVILLDGIREPSGIALTIFAPLRPAVKPIVDAGISRLHIPLDIIVRFECLVVR